MVSFSSFNPSCYLPSGITSNLPSAIACAPPPSTVRTLYGTLTSPILGTYTALRTGMDALLSVPFLSFLLIPTMTSYSTSLNLLFFYLTWSTLVLSHSPLRVEIVAVLAVRILFYIVPSLFFLAFDLAIPSLSESFKSLGADALPLKNVRRKTALKHVRMLWWSLFNVLLSAFLQGGVQWILTAQLGRQTGLKITTSLPLPSTILVDILRGFLLRDVLTYLIHRYVLHSNNDNALVRDLTQLHTSWYHTAIAAPFPLSPSYDHPLAYVFKSFLPTYLPALFWRFHLLTYILYLILVSLEDTFTHSGYAVLPTNFILGGIARRNDMHCLAEGAGNFGTWGLTDWIMGTSVGVDAVGDVLDEIQEADVIPKITKSAGRGVSRAKKATAARVNSGATRRKSRRQRIDSDYDE